MPQSTILEINTGRVASVRVAPNQDLLEALDQAAAHLGFRRALVRSGLGSLIDATFVGANGKPRRVEGPAVELLSLSGEISLDEKGVAPAGVSGVVGDPTGAVWAGRFVRGLNPVCITIEAVLEELLVAPEEDWRNPF
jgi:predicted DNA-binding protein with PD1-like motif